MSANKTSVEAIETARLVGRRIVPDDFELFRRLLQNPQVAATLGGICTDEQVREAFDRHFNHWNRNRFGLWVWRSKAEGRFVGRAGLHQVFVGGHDEIEIGYALMPEFWNQGLATEVAKASIEVAFTRLEMQELVSFTLPTNLASRRVMEKCGLKYEKDFVWKDLPHVLYRLKRS